MASLQLLTNHPGKSTSRRQWQVNSSWQNHPGPSAHYKSTARGSQTVASQRSWPVNSSWQIILRRQWKVNSSWQIILAPGSLQVNGSWQIILAPGSLQVNGLWLADSGKSTAHCKSTTPGKSSWQVNISQTVASQQLLAKSSWLTAHYKSTARGSLTVASQQFMTSQQLLANHIGQTSRVKSLQTFPGKS